MDDFSNNPFLQEVNPQEVDQGESWSPEEGRDAPVEQKPRETTPNPFLANMKDPNAPEFAPEPSMKLRLSPQMWNMPYEDAMPIYNEMKRVYGDFYTDPETGEKIVIPKPVPGPLSVPRKALSMALGDDSFEVQAANNPIERAVGIVSNAGRGLVEFGAAVGDTLTKGNKVPTGYNEDGSVQGWRDLTEEEVAARAEKSTLTESVRQNIPRYPQSENIGGRILDEGLPMVVGGNLAFKGYKHLAKVTESLSKDAYKLLARGGLFTGTQGIGAAATAPSDGGTLLVGDQAMVPVIPGFEDLVDMDESEASKVIQARMNVLADAAITAGIFDGIGNVSTGVAGFVNETFISNLLNFGSKEGKEKVLVGSILNDLAVVTGRETPEEVAELTQRISGILKDPDNTQMVLDMSEAGIENIRVPDDTMAAIERGLQGDESFEAKRMIARLRELRKSNLAGGAPQNELSLSQIPEARDKVLDAFTTKAGGEESIPRGATAIQAEADRQFAPIKGMVNDLESALAKNDDTIVRLLQEDPLFADNLQKAGKAVGFNINIDMTNSATKIREDLQKLYDVMKKQSDDLYNAIPEGTIVDLDIIRDENDAFSELFPPNIKKLLEDSGGDYKVLNNEVLPVLSRELKTLYKTGESKTGRYLVDHNAKITALESLRKFIKEDAFEQIVDGPPSPAKAAAEAARTNYRQNFAPLWRSGELDKFARARQNENIGWDIPTAQQTQRDVFKEVFDPENVSLTNHVVKAMSSPDYSGSPEDAINYIIGRAATKVLDQVQAGKLIDEIDIQPMLRELGQYGETIQQQFPEYYTKIDNFAKSVQNAKLSKKGLEAQLKGAKEAMEASRENIYNASFKEFFQKSGTGIVPVTGKGAYKAFEDLFKDPNNSEKIQSIIEAGKNSGDPIIQNGLEVAILRELSNKFKTGAFNLTGQRKANTQAFVKATEGSDPIFDYLDMVYQDKPTASYTIKRIIGMTHDQAVRVTGQGAGASAGTVNPNDFIKNARQSTDSIITMIWGPLDRAGARIRSVSSRAFSYLDRNAQTAAILDNIYANPEEFTRVLDSIIASGQTKRGGRTAARLMADLVIKWGIYGKEDEPLLLEMYENFEGGYTPDPEVPKANLKKFQEEASPFPSE